VRAAVDGVRKGGTVTLIGNLSSDVSLPLQALVTRQIRLQGSCASSGEYPECIDLIGSGKVEVECFISAEAPLEQGPAWFDRLYRREPGLMKVLLRPNG
jgi:L-iditol 2-dehydrogenase